MRVLVIQHSRAFHVGAWKEIFHENGLGFDVISFQNSVSTPDLDAYDALVVLGGEAHVWEVDKHPWLEQEKALIREAAIEQKIPYFGICLGHQLLADVIGGTVELTQTPMVGVGPINFTKNVVGDPIFGGSPVQLECLWWNESVVTKLPSDSTCLARSSSGAVQAMRYGSHAYGVQGHPELSVDDIAAFSKSPSIKSVAEMALGAGAISQIKRDFTDRQSCVRESGSMLMGKFIELVKKNKNEKIQHHSLRQPNMQKNVMAEWPCDTD